MDKMITRVCYWCKGTGIERKLPRDNMWNLVTCHVCGGEGVVEWI